MAPGLAIVTMVAAVGGLLLVDSGVRHGSAGLRMPLLAVAGGFAMRWGYELNVQLIGALTGQRATTLLLLSPAVRSEEHTSELQSLMRTSYAVFCMTKKNSYTTQQDNTETEDATK